MRRETDRRVEKEERDLSLEEECDTVNEKGVKPGEKSLLEVASVRCG